MFIHIATATEEVNKMAYEYIEKINPADELEKSLSFRFTFKDLPTELTSLEQTIALAYPYLTSEQIKQKYLDQVAAGIPYESRRALLDDVEKRHKLVEMGAVSRPYTGPELDQRILFHCRGLERKQVKTPHRVAVVSAEIETSESERQTPPKANQSENQVRREIGPNYGVKLILAAIKQLKTEKVPLIQQIKEAMYIKSPGRPPKSQPQIPAKYAPKRTQLSQPKAGFKPRYTINERPNYRAYNPNFTPRERREKVRLANPADQHYSEFVMAAREAQKVKNFSEMIDKQNEKAPLKLEEEIRQNQLNKQTSQPTYNWHEGRYKVDQCRKIDFPVFRKIGDRTPDLTSEALRHFSKCCHACGIENCRGKIQGDCAYKGKPDAWYLCSKCKLGFHLHKDCLADLN